MHRQLLQLQDQLAAATARTRTLVDPLDERTFNRQPRPGAWSVGECLDHLNITTNVYLPLIDSVLLTGSTAHVPDEAVYRPGMIGGLLAWSLEPPYRMKTKTPPRFVPPPSHEKQATLGEFIKLQEMLRERLDYCDGRDLNHMKINSPFSTSIRYNLYAAFLTLLAHERRHLWQGEQTVAALQPQPALASRL